MQPFFASRLLKGLRLLPSRSAAKRPFCPPHMPCLAMWASLLRLTDLAWWRHLAQRLHLVRLAIAFCLLVGLEMTALLPPPAYAAGSSSFEGSVTAQTTETRKAEKKAFSAFATAGLPFGGLVHQDAVFAIARATAFLEALHEAALSLNRHTAAHIGAFALERRTALAAAAYAAAPIVSKSVSDAPAPFAGQEELTILVKLEISPALLDARIRQTLRHGDTWALYEEALALMRQQTEEGINLVHKAAQLRQSHGIHMDEIFMQRINYLADNLDALWMYLRILHTLRTSWEDPAQVQAQMQRALTLAPRSPFLWCALGEAQLQLDFPQLAIESLDKAVRFDPAFARALYARGLAHLRLQQSALAENDLSAALALRPHTLPWLRARGAVRMVREDYGPMCEDFSEACALGDCDGLMTARKRQLCLPDEPAPPAKNSADTPEDISANTPPKTPMDRDAKPSSATPTKKIVAPLASSPPDTPDAPDTQDPPAPPRNTGITNNIHKDSTNHVTP